MATMPPHAGLNQTSGPGGVAGCRAGGWQCPCGLTAKRPFWHVDW